VRASDHTGERHTVRWRLPWSTLACLVWVCWLLLGLGVSLARAQGEGTWTPPVLLSQGIMDASGIPAGISNSVLAADMWGGVHSFWSAVFEEDAAIGDTLFYSFWDGTAWSAPLDVLYTPGKLIWIPKAVVDSRGLLHVAWTDNPTGQVWYARVPVTEASSVRAWSQPIAVPAGLASGLSISVDGAETVHLVYCGTGEYQGVYHTSSSDGSRWSTSAYVGDTGNTASEFVECRLSSAVDAKGRLHVVWGQSLVQVAPIYYSRSDDGGISWVPPVEVDRRDEKYSGLYAPGRPNLVAIGHDEIHLVWFGAPAGQRWHQWSADGGKTWSPAQPISTEVRGFMEPPALAADNAGTLHLVSRGWIDEGPSGTFYTYWRHGRWSPFSLIDKDVRYEGPYSSHGGGEFAALVVTGGDTLHAVWEVGLAEIWASSLEVDAPAVPPRPQPTLQTRSTDRAISTSAVIATPLGSAAMPTALPGTGSIPSRAPSGVGGSGLEVALIATLPSVVLVGLALFVRRAQVRK
jgi:hypothetical protein